jgi:hypothetical protein
MTRVAKLMIVIYALGILGGLLGAAWPFWLWIPYAIGTGTVLSFIYEELQDKSDA